MNENEILPLADTSSKTTNCLFVGDLSVCCTELNISDLFSEYGQVIKVRLKQGRSDYKSMIMGFAFVTFLTSEATELARTALNGATFFGRKLRVFHASRDTTIPGPSEATVEVLFSFKSSQIERLIYEETLIKMITDLVSYPVADVMFKNYVVVETTEKFFGSGFIHFSQSLDGIVAAIKAMRLLNGVSVEGVFYDCKMAHSFGALIASNPTMYREAQAMASDADTSIAKQMIETTRFGSANGTTVGESTGGDNAYGEPVHATTTTSEGGAILYSYMHLSNMRHLMPMGRRLEDPTQYPQPAPLHQSLSLSVAPSVSNATTSSASSTPSPPRAPSPTPSIDTLNPGPQSTTAGGSGSTADGAMYRTSPRNGYYKSDRSGYAMRPMNTVQSNRYQQQQQRYPYQTDGTQYLQGSHQQQQQQQQQQYSHAAAAAAMYGTAAHGINPYQQGYYYSQQQQPLPTGHKQPYQYQRRVYVQQQQQSQSQPQQQHAQSVYRSTYLAAGYMAGQQQHQQHARPQQQQGAYMASQQHYHVDPRLLQAYGYGHAPVAGAGSYGSHSTGGYFTGATDSHTYHQEVQQQHQHQQHKREEQRDGLSDGGEQHQQH